MSGKEKRAMASLSRAAPQGIFVVQMSLGPQDDIAAGTEVSWHIGSEGAPEFHYHRNNRGPNIAPAMVHSAIVPPYQTATNGNESSVQ